MGTNPNKIPSHFDEQRRLVAQQRYFEHQRELAAAGHDPNMIGTTEVPPPCCPSCSRPIPWAVLNLYR